MSDLSRFDGVFTALITPFTQSGDIDWVAFDRLIDRQLAAGITGLVPVGTTGEAATLTSKEADALIAHTVKRAKGKAYVLAGTGSNSTAKTIAATQRATELGVDGGFDRHSLLQQALTTGVAQPFLCGGRRNHSRCRALFCARSGGG